MVDLKDAAKTWPQTDQICAHCGGNLAETPDDMMEAADGYVLVCSKCCYLLGTINPEINRVEEFACAKCHSENCEIKSSGANLCNGELYLEIICKDCSAIGTIYGKITGIR